MAVAPADQDPPVTADMDPAVVADKDPAVILVTLRVHVIPGQVTRFMFTSPHPITPFTRMPSHPVTLNL